jgi:5-methylcytosine-specific restriction endonuclease McrA
VSSKKKCGGCKEYFPNDDVIRAGIQSFCSLNCLYKARKRKGPNKTASRKIPPGVRAQVKARDRDVCQMCLSKPDYWPHELHHIIYRSQGGEHTRENLITLCKKCHNMVHSNKRKWQEACLRTVALLNKGRRTNVREVEKAMRK